MARSLRIEYSGACYHVTCRGNVRREIFADDPDRKRFLESLATIGRELGGVSVSARSQNRSRLAERMKDDRQLRQRFQKLERALSS
jgi:hypothetical protein